ncbi:MAG: amino acid ABC transporter substrate-binding protein [Rhodospirillales bacterium]|jgi:branched-chain amino acid transport system substrate-binding protein|nr:amino acid ABC transporter substrate-binding protein [Rhodospirillales bacterium]
MLKTKLKQLTFLIACAALFNFSSVDSASAKVEGDTIIFGAAVSFTGKYSTNGKHTKNGYDLAVERINAKGGVTVAGKNYKLAVQYYDDESTPARAAALVERLIQQDGIKFLLGPYGSGLTKAIAPVTEKYGIPMVEGNGASRSLFNKGYKYLFAVLSTSEQYLAESISLAAEQAKKAGRDPSTVTVAIAVENDPFSQDIRAGVMDDAKKFGMKVVIDDKLPKELSDMTATLTKVKALKPDVLVVSGHSKGASLVIRQVNEMKVNVPMLAITHCEAADVIGKFGAGAENTLCATQWTETMSYHDDYFGTAMDYFNDFKAKYEYDPPYQAAESTASVQVYVDAIQRAGSFDTDKIRDALAATDLATFYGQIKFSEAGNNIAKPMVLRQVQNGKYVAVAPTKFATVPVVYPRPNF